MPETTIVLVVHMLEYMKNVEWPGMSKFDLMKLKKATSIICTCNEILNNGAAEVRGQAYEESRCCATGTTASSK
jgi:hypothetical protein